MKMNKWTLGLAAVGLVSLTPALRAQTAPTPMATPVPALSATTISGYVDTSAVWVPGTGNANPAPYAFNAGKADGFNLDAVDIKVSKALDESQWAAGYTAELMYGPNATAALGGFAPLRQAFVELRANVGNGLDFKLGEWDNLIGFEGTDAMNNGNWTRSYGYTIEPTEHVGLLAEYKFGKDALVDLKVGLADELSTGLNRNVSGTPPPGEAGPNTYTTIETKKAIVSLLTLTAPDSWGGFKGSTLVAGVDYGPGNAFGHSAPGEPATPAADSHVVDKTHYYIGATINTPVKDLSVGAAFDSVNNSDVGGPGSVEGYAGTYAVYLHYKPTDKLSFDTRAEYAHGSAFDYLFAGNYWVNSKGEFIVPQEAKVFAVTETVGYALWGDKVISRLEARWDTSADGSPMFGGTQAGSPTKHNEIMVGANVIYKF
jgi:hypothetical protein